MSGAIDRAVSPDYPDIELDIVVEDRLVDIVADRFDAGIRLNEMVEKDMVSVRLAATWR